MTTPLDLEWARRCARDFADKPTEARARNAAQCLAGVLTALDILQSAYNALAGGWVAPPEPCRDEHEGLICYLVAGHPGDHSTNVYHREPATWPQEQATTCPGNDHLPCFRPSGHEGTHSTAPEWLRVGIDPCPARSHQQESCLKGYLHTGGHEWGGTKPVIAGPDLGTLTTVGTQPWQGCPNQACPHPAMAHDIESFEEPRPMCCEEGCGCGRPSPSAQI